MARAMDRLFERIAGQQPKQDRHAALDGQSGKLAAHRAVDMLVVGRFAANDRA
jgi:hypothetical protein